MLQQLGAQHRAYPELTLLQLLGVQGFPDEVDPFCIVQFVIDFGLDLLIKLFNAAENHLMVAWVEIFPYFLLILRQDKIPAGDLPGQQIHDTGAQTSGRCLVPGHIVQINGDHAGVGAEHKPGTAGHHRVVTVSLIEGTADVVQQPLFRVITLNGAEHIPDGRLSQQGGHFSQQGHGLVVCPLGGGDIPCNMQHVPDFKPGGGIPPSGIMLFSDAALFQGKIHQGFRTCAVKSGVILAIFPEGQVHQAADDLPGGAGITGLTGAGIHTQCTEDGDHEVLFRCDGFSGPVHHIKQVAGVVRVITQNDPHGFVLSLLRQAVTDKLYQSLCTESLVDIGNEREILLG